MEVKKAVGLDAGSQTTKVVVLDGTNVLASVIVNSGDDIELSARTAVEQALQKTGARFDNSVYITATGIGAKSISFSHQQKGITTCLARGIHHVLPSVQLAIDMGAESSTVLKINERGRLSDYANHDKCAAGTGMFLQQMARLMQMSLDEMSATSLKAKSRAEITNTCAVFAESEVISHVHRVPPTPKEDIIAGIFYSVVSRMITLCKRVGIKKDVTITGGVGLNKGLVHIFEEEFGFGLLVPESPQMVAALGAAILSKETLEKELPGK
jgi:predicted CoA-substrate-specific enzyme activase